MGCVKISTERIGRFVVEVIGQQVEVISASRRNRIRLGMERVDVPDIAAERHGRPVLSCSFVCGLSLGPEMTIFDASDGWFVTADGLRIQIII